jgi:hypothetical protein
MAALRGSAAAIGVAIWLAATPAGAQSAAHLGVASCSGSNCHGATEQPPGSPIPGNEYVIWSKRDKHRQAYTVLLEERAVRMARAIGLPDAANQKLCLDCHADNVPMAQRGRQFQISDGVGCEACHGGAAQWLGVHISGASHRDNLAAGLYPTEQPAARAEKCLGCHQGDDKRFVDHRLYGAGHPRLGFELGTYTAIQPAHVVVDKRYVERKGRITDMQVWAAGQAVTVVKRMTALIDRWRGERALVPDFALFDCQACHHPYDPQHARAPARGGPGPGTIRLDDANQAMLQAATARLAPAQSRSLGWHALALERATIEGPDSVPREAAVLRDTARGLLPVVANREFAAGDIRALGAALTALGQSPEGGRLSHAEQTTMALAAVAAALKSSGSVGPAQGDALKHAMDALYASFPGEGRLRQEAFAAALRDVERALRR